MQCVLLGDWPVIRFPRRASRSGQEFGQFRGSPPLLAVVSQQPDVNDCGTRRKGGSHSRLIAVTQAGYPPRRLRAARSDAWRAVGRTPTDTRGSLSSDVRKCLMRGFFLQP